MAEDDNVRHVVALFDLKPPLTVARAVFDETLRKLRFFMKTIWFKRARIPG